MSYYRKTFGFDPARDRTYDLVRSRYYYEAAYPLERDVAFHRAGIEVLARVEVDVETGRTTNRIVFRRGTREASVTCVHTAVAHLSVEQVLSSTQEEIVELARSTEHAPVELPPEEHFASLKSYVAAISEQGLINVLSASYFSSVDPELIPFGFNAEMQFQVLRALRSLAPRETRAAVRDMLVRVALTTPEGWFLNRLALLDRIYDVGDAVATDPVAFEAIDEAVNGAEFRKFCAKYEHVHPDVLNAVAGDARADVRKEAASNPRLSRRAVAKLLADAEEQVVKTVLENPAVPPDLLAEVVARGEPQLTEWALANPNVDEATLARAAVTPGADARVLLAVASHARATAAVLSEVARAPSTAVKLRVLEHPNASGQLVATLAKDDDPKVRGAVARHWKVPTAALEAMVRDANAGVRLAVARNPNVSPRALQVLARDPDYEVRDVVALHYKAPNAALELLADDPDWHVRLSLATRGRLPPAVRERLEKNLRVEAFVPVVYRGSWIVRGDATGLFAVEEATSTNLRPLEEAEGGARGFVARQGRVTGLSLRGVGLVEIPVQVRSLDALEWLDVAENDLVLLPQWLGELGNLRSLLLEKNRVEFLPNSIAALRHLTRLDISANQLKCLPDLTPLVELVAVTFGDNPLESFPNLPLRVREEVAEQYAHLELPLDERLALGDLQLLLGRPLEQVPPDDLPVRDVTPFFLNVVDEELKFATSGGHVVAVSLLTRKVLRELPPSVGKLAGLRALQVPHNHLERLPETLVNATGLEYLDVHGNRLEALPVAVGSWTKLRSLLASDNVVSSLPPQLLRLERLRELDLGGNHLQAGNLSEEFYRWARRLRSRGCEVRPSWLAV
ncbi:MAG: hypothetical protein Kow0069_34820 [Promethearchaeota archaeon]